MVEMPHLWKNRPSVEELQALQGGRRKRRSALRHLDERLGSKFKRHFSPSGFNAECAFIRLH
jgi:hypothetical protein